MVPTRDSSFETREHTLSAAATTIELVRLFAFSLRSSHDEDVWSVDESFLGFFTLGKSPNRSIFLPLGEEIALRCPAKYLLGELL